jgi:hypothetical protein
MLARRVVVALPARTPDSTWSAVVALAGAALERRGLPCAAEARAALGYLRPVASYLLTMHHLEGGHVELDCGGLRLVVACAYGGVGDEENLSLPPLEGLGPPGPGDTPRVTFRTSRPLLEPILVRLAAAVGRGGALEVRLACT